MCNEARLAWRGKGEASRKEVARFRSNSSLQTRAGDVPIVIMGKPTLRICQTETHSNLQLRGFKGKNQQRIFDQFSSLFFKALRNKVGTKSLEAPWVVFLLLGFFFPANVMGV